MNLIDSARADFASIMNDPFGSSRLIEFSDVDRTRVCSVMGSGTIMNTSIDVETALNVNGERVHVLVSLDSLENAGYPVRRDVSDPTKITLTGDIVRWTDKGRSYVFTCEDVRPTNSNNSLTIYLGRWIDE